jgi:hypothetical protein
MFKRVEKRRQKKEDADKLELDERWQEVLGFHDTDSEESASEESNSEWNDDAEGSDTGGRVVDSEDEEGEDQEMTVSQALIDPLYVASSLQPDVKACIVCPGKVLKGPKMEELHLASNACMLLLASRSSASCSFRCLLCIFFPLGPCTTVQALQPSRCRC